MLKIIYLNSVKIIVVFKVFYINIPVFKLFEKLQLYIFKIQFTKNIQESNLFEIFLNIELKKYIFDYSP